MWPRLETKENHGHYPIYSEVQGQVNEHRVLAMEQVIGFQLQIAVQESIHWKKNGEETIQDHGTLQVSRWQGTGHMMTFWARYSRI